MPSPAIRPLVMQTLPAARQTSTAAAPHTRFEHRLADTRRTGIAAGDQIEYETTSSGGGTVSVSGGGEVTITYAGSVPNKDTFNAYQLIRWRCSDKQLA